jgi:hypothetical protein
MGLLLGWWVVHWCRPLPPWRLIEIAPTAAAPRALCDPFTTTTIVSGPADGSTTTSTTATFTFTGQTDMNSGDAFFSNWYE